MPSRPRRRPAHSRHRALRTGATSAAARHGPRRRALREFNGASGRDSRAQRAAKAGSAPLERTTEVLAAADPTVVARERVVPPAGRLGAERHLASPRALHPRGSSSSGGRTATRPGEVEVGARHARRLRERELDSLEAGLFERAADAAAARRRRALGFREYGSSRDEGHLRMIGEMTVTSRRGRGTIDARLATLNRTYTAADESSPRSRVMGGGADGRALIRCDQEAREAQVAHAKVELLIKLFACQGAQAWAMDGAEGRVGAGDPLPPAVHREHRHLDRRRTSAAASWRCPRPLPSPAG